MYDNASDTRRSGKWVKLGDFAGRDFLTLMDYAR